MVGGALLTDLETRIANGERYLKAHIDDVEARALFDSLVDRHAALCARLVCVLDLPEHVRWSTARDSRSFSRVRVVLHGDCERENDVTPAQLKALLGTVAMVRAAERGTKP